jgi:hypothetical protein
MNEISETGCYQPRSFANHYGMVRSETKIKITSHECLTMLRFRTVSIWLYIKILGAGKIELVKIHGHETKRRN